MLNPILNYTLQGQGDPLLIIHGLFGSLRNWQTLSKGFAEHFKVISLDLRNHGDSFHDEEMSYTFMAEDVLLLMDELGLTSAHVLGHSMGGKVAMTLCHNYPQRVNKLIIADIAPLTYRHNYDELIVPILELDISSFKSRKEADLALAGSITDQRIRLFLMQNLSLGGGVLQWKLNWTALHKNMEALIGFPSIISWSIDNQSLFIRGALSDYVLDENWAFIQSHFTQARLHTINNAGHWLHADQPALFHDEVLKFLLD